MTSAGEADKEIQLVVLDASALLALAEFAEAWVIAG